MNKKRIEIFFEFVIFGVLLGMLEDIIAIKVIHGGVIDFSIIKTVFLVAFVFSFLGEYIVDNIDFVKIFKLNKKYKRLEVFFEFILFGIVMGVVEDSIAVTLSTGEPVTWTIVGLITLITIPFAFVGEVLVDRIDFIKLFSKKN